MFSRKRSDGNSVDALAARFAGMPYLVDDFMGSVSRLAHAAAKEKGSDFAKARRYFAEKLSRDYVVGTIAMYAARIGEEGARRMLADIANLCYFDASATAISELGVDDSTSLQRQMDSLRSVRDPDKALSMLRTAARPSDRVSIRRTTYPRSIEFGGR